MGYVETNDPYQKIKYFKKLIKFKNKNDTENELFFVPRNVQINTTIPENKSIISFQHNVSSSNDSGNKFSYDIIKNNGEFVTNLNNNEVYLQENVSNEIKKNNTYIIKETNKKQNINDIDSSTNLIGKEQVGNKIVDDVDINNNSNKPNGMNSLKISEKHLNNSFNDFEIRKFLNEHVKYNSNNMTIHKAWSKWSSWSACSRTCDDGIKSQSRECVLKIYQGGKKINTTIIHLNECIGLYKRYRICNEKKCSNMHNDFRSEQCSEFNNQSYRGKHYEWEPYVKDGAECELNCKPINQKYFARLKERVIDGTECNILKQDLNKLDNIYKSVCIEGSCKVVFKNGVIFGSSVNTGNVRCGSNICRPVSQIFGKNPLPNGYNHVATIPATASNITILELEDSINLLALKSTEAKFIINGNYTSSPVGTYNIGGAEFEYFRLDEKNKLIGSNLRNDGVTEWITSNGPLFEPVHLLILSQQNNLGVKYEYLLPINFAISEESDSDYSEENLAINSKLKAANRQTDLKVNVRKKRKFYWKVIGFTECNKSCGGGIQHPIIRCVRGDENNMKIYSKKKCTHLKTPLLSENLMKCNNHPCPAFWKISNWSNCKCEDFSKDKSVKSRDVKCVQELISGVVIQVNAGACSEERPQITAVCECKNFQGKTESPKAIQNSSILQQNTQNDQNISSNRNNKIKIPKSKKSGMWLISDWSEECLGECDHMGQQFRTIFCDRSTPNMERCDIRFTPNIYRECVNNAPECIEGSWFVGPWSKCIGDCWNASRSRTVICIKNDGFAEENECNLNKKPPTFEDCKIEDLKECRAKWHYSEWTECSKSCGNGMQKRTVKCLEVDKKDMTLRESNSCKYLERPTSMRYCNTQSCSETTTRNPRVDIIQNDDPQCRDKLSNCFVVLQKINLCAYHYYSENCCQSCNSN
ncbi:thrombospondin type-1 domain-containing protein 4 isoform X2 [Chironomus tepperi]